MKVVFDKEKLLTAISCDLSTFSNFVIKTEAKDKPFINLNSFNEKTKEYNPGKCDDAETWSDFKTVISNGNNNFIREASSVAIALPLEKNGLYLYCIDIDRHCIEELPEEVIKDFCELKTSAEISIHGQGYHFWGWATDEQRKRINELTPIIFTESNGKKNAIEAFTGTSNHFVTFGQELLPGRDKQLPISETVTETIISLLAKYRELYPGIKTPPSNNLPCEKVYPSEWLKANIREILEHIPEYDDYNKYYQTGMALKLADIPFEVWHSWASRSNKNPGEEADRKKWNSFKREGNQRVITVGSLIQEARRNGFSKKAPHPTVYCYNSPLEQSARDGSTRPTTTNYLTIMRNHEMFKGFWYNDFRKAPYFHDKLIGDQEEAQLICEIERLYGINSRENFNLALRTLCSDKDRKRNPVHDFIKGLTWDNVPRVEKTLSTWGSCPDDVYSRECSRMIFAEGITRVFEPGSKCEVVVIFKGKQGVYKSTFIEMLAYKQEWFCEADELNREILDGKWIVELQEMIAISGKDDKKVKSFISTKQDTYRKPYEKHPQDYLRTCIFIGSTNEDAVITDSTGGRRWLPIDVDFSALASPEKKEECAEYIKQCWAEMYHYYITGDSKAKPYSDRNNTELQEAITEAYELSYEADVWEEPIKQWTSRPENNIVYPLGLYDELLRGKLNRPAEKSDIKRIKAILKRLGYVSSKTSVRIEYEGKTEPHRVYIRDNPTEVECNVL